MLPDSEKQRTTRQQLGFDGETFVATYLQQQGFTILERNYRKRYGEIDLIANKGNLLVFVEVKMRRYRYFHLSQAITPTKQRKIIKTAKAYISKHQINDTIYRFDVALIELHNNSHQLTYIPNAFTDTRTY